VCFLPPSQLQVQPLLLPLGLQHRQPPVGAHVAATAVAQQLACVGVPAGLAGEAGRQLKRLSVNKLPGSLNSVHASLPCINSLLTTQIPALLYHPPHLRHMPVLVAEQWVQRRSSKAACTHTRHAELEASEQQTIQASKFQCHCKLDA
jgi:hypothetical protein